MLPKYIIYVIPTTILQIHSFYLDKDPKILWPDDKPVDFPYDSIEDAIENTAPAKNETQIIKDKLSSLILQTKDDVAEKIKTIDQVHRNFENNSLYKVGYVISFLNSTCEDFIKMYEYIDMNKRDWSVLTLLENYEQVKSAESFISQMLRVLQNLMYRKPKISFHHERNKPSPYESGIAWSYYDDAGH